MSNPYQSPLQTSIDRDPRSDVQGPAISLMAVSLIAVICGTAALVADVYLIVSGAVAKLEAMNEGPISEYTQITVRTIWGAVLVIASSFVLYGAVQMRRLRSFGTARAAAIVAMIPLLGPCCILGIPFGIWAFVVLVRPGVRKSFT